MQDLFRCELDPYSGPIDLLLFLIREHKLTVEEVRLAEIADQYLDFVQSMETLDLSVASSYLVVAANLIQIKSRLLLPNPKGEEGINEAVDLKQQLMARIRENLLFKGAAEELDGRVMLYREHFPRPDQAAELASENESWITPSIVDLAESFRHMLGRVARRVVPIPGGRHKALRLHLADMLNRLRNVFHDQERISFADLQKDLTHDGEDSRPVVIVTFLGALQMAANGVLGLFQREPLAPLWVERGRHWHDADLSKLTEGVDDE